MPPESSPLPEPVDLVLHIGSGKTGTSSIQSFLRENRDRLAGHGLLYPRTPGQTRHTRFGLFVRPDQELLATPAWRREDSSDPAAFRAAFEREFLAEIRGSGLSRVLLSDEALYGMGERGLERLRAFTDSHARRVRVVCYLRRQDEHLVSRYQQVVKWGEVRRLTDRMRELDLARTYDYAARLDTWARVVEPAELVVRRFARDGFRGGSLYEDFLHASDVDVPLDVLKPVSRKNESLDAESVEFLRILNIHKVGREGARIGSVNNRKVVRRLAEASRGATLTLPEPVLDAFMARWHEGNRYVAERYVGDGGELFGNARRTEGTTSRQYLDPDRLDHFFSVTRLPERLHAPIRRLAVEEAH